VPSPRCPHLRSRGLPNRRTERRSTRRRRGGPAGPRHNVCRAALQPRARRPAEPREASHCRASRSSAEGSGIAAGFWNRQSRSHRLPALAGVAEPHQRRAGSDELLPEHRCAGAQLVRVGEERRPELKRTGHRDGPRRQESGERRALWHTRPLSRTRDGRTERARPHLHRATCFARAAQAADPGTRPQLPPAAAKRRALSSADRRFSLEPLQRTRR
jgi:hypothetical protein